MRRGGKVLGVAALVAGMLTVVLTELAALLAALLGGLLGPTEDAGPPVNARARGR